jgi:hypothetical protein
MRLGGASAQKRLGIVNYDRRCGASLVKPLNSSQCPPRFIDSADLESHLLVATSLLVTELTDGRQGAR